MCVCGGGGVGGVGGGGEEGLNLPRGVSNCRNLQLQHELIDLFAQK